MIHMPRPPTTRQLIEALRAHPVISRKLRAHFLEERPLTPDEAATLLGRQKAYGPLRAQVLSEIDAIVNAARRADPEGFDEFRRRGLTPTPRSRYQRVKLEALAEAVHKTLCEAQRDGTSVEKRAEIIRRKLYG